MTREEEDRRLALSTAVAKVNAAIDLISEIDSEAIGCRALVARTLGMMGTVRDAAQAGLDALRRKAIDEEREATKK